MTGERTRVLLLTEKTSYRTEAFLEAAASLGALGVVGSDRCHVLAGILDFQDGSLALDLGHPERAATQIVDAARERPFAAIVPTSDATSYIAALAGMQLGLRHNPPDAAYRARNKHAMRQALQSAGVPCPGFLVFPCDSPPEEVAAVVGQRLGYPCVVKPLLLAGSRGVIRADGAAACAEAFARVTALLGTAELRAVAQADPAGAQVLVETFVPGPEVALEGLLDHGQLHGLAIFDKPDPLDGPFFTETIYITPSRWPEGLQERLLEVTAHAARAMGLEQGPVHAELRLGGVAGATGPTVIEVAARTIGGLCARALRFSLGDGDAGGQTLEQLVVAAALGQLHALPVRRTEASGVLMLPVPCSGVLRDIVGVEAAARVPGIVEITMTSRPGERVVALPEGASYLGFVFARGVTPVAVEGTLRRAWRELRIDIATRL